MRNQGSGVRGQASGLRLGVILLAVFVFASVTAPQLGYAANEKPIKFVDVTEDNPLFEDMVWLVKQGILSASDNSFKPDEEVKRAFLVAILVNVNKVPLLDKHQGTFDDVPDDFWAAKYIEAAVKGGYVAADQIKFNPNDTLTETEAQDMIEKFNKLGRVKRVTNLPLTRGRLVEFLMKIDVIKAKRDTSRDVEIVSAFGDDKSKKLRTAIFMRDSLNKFVEGNAIDAKDDIEYAYTIQPKDTMIIAIRNMIKGDPSVAQADNLKIEMSSSNDLLTKKLNESLYHFYNNRFDEVIRTGEEILRIDPKNTTAMMRMGSAYYMIKDYPNAKLQWEHILEIDPNNSEAQSFMVEINKLLEQ